MSFVIRVAASYQYILNDLKSNHREPVRLVKALTDEAIEDIQYFEAISHVIEQQVYKVSS